MLSALTVIAAILAASIVLFLGLGFARLGGKTRADEDYEKLISELTKSEVETESKKDGLPDPKSWTGFWYKYAVLAGWQPASIGTPSRAALGIVLFAFLIGWFVWPQDILAGIGFSIGGLVAFRIFLNSKASARRKLMEHQLPNLINGMRANLQANLTPQQAILSQVDEIGAPLGDELKILRQELNVNVPLEKALTNLALRVPSREIKFLVSSIKIAIASGVDLDPQLQIIQEIITQRARISNSLAAAVASVQPSLWVSGIAIPAGFIFSYYSNPDNQAFWVSPLGIIALVVVFGLYAVGMIISRRLVKRVENA